MLDGNAATAFCCPLLQASINERLKQLQDAHRDFGPGSQHFLSCT